MNDIKLVNKNNKFFKVNKNKNLYFWEKLESDEWETKTFQVFDDFISSDSIFLDIGAWIGPTTLYGSQLAKKTYAFEPDPVAYKELKENVELNKEYSWYSNINIYNKAVYYSEGKIRMGNKKSTGNSMSSILFSEEDISWEIECIMLEKLVKDEKLSNSNLFIKMDIEGGEYNLIPRLTKFFKNHNITLFLSTHPQNLIEKKNLFSKIKSRFYSSFLQFRLFKSLPFKYIYDCKQRRMNIYINMMLWILFGRIRKDIIATNKKWNQ